ncbi:mersacidin/lichenicidin family type 2 lantibiotic [Candidatus Leptofilum sp.]|uniref:mersacidin/lichenicidin family type 2 lantibiotic n=1 Tax=Candidatus Leptofilum sp. TaxID=3241576 RepID=UPI003B5A67E6
MSQIDVIRAWKNKDFRNSLSKEEHENLPPHPSGLIEIPDDVLSGASGGTTAYTLECTYSCMCGGPTYHGNYCAL